MLDLFFCFHVFGPSVTSSLPSRFSRASGLSGVPRAAWRKVTRNTRPLIDEGILSSRSGYSLRKPLCDTTPSARHAPFWPTRRLLPVPEENTAGEETQDNQHNTYIPHGEVKAVLPHSQRRDDQAAPKIHMPTGDQRTGQGKRKRKNDRFGPVPQNRFTATGTDEKHVRTDIKASHVRN